MKLRSYDDEGIPIYYQKYLLQPGYCWTDDEAEATDMDESDATALAAELTKDRRARNWIAPLVRVQK